MTESKENYLKTIYKLIKDDKFSNVELAHRLNISPASVSGMLKKLTKEGLLEVNENKKISLTEKGKSLALLTLRKHRVWEVFLVNVLNYNVEEVHEEAELLEHVTSKKLLNKLEKFLYFPNKKLTGKELMFNEEIEYELRMTELSNVDINERVMIISLDNNPKLYAYVKQKGMKTREVYKVVEKEEFNGPIHLIKEVYDSSEKPIEISISLDAAKIIEVYKID